MKNDHYWGFISYSWKDKSFASRLHRKLERFVIPRRLRVQFGGTHVRPARRLRPIFRDADEMTMTGRLSDRLRSAIAESATLVLLASPDAARSAYVNDEVEYFLA